MTATAIPMPGGFVVPSAGPAPTPTVPPAGPDAPMPGTQPQYTQPDAPVYGQPVPMRGQVPGYMQPQAPATTPDFDAAVQAEVQRRMGLQQPTQPAPTQQVPPMQEPAKEAPGWLPKDLNTFDPASLQDPVLRSMGQMMQVVGKDLDLNRVLGNALARQDASLIDMAYLVEKGGANAPQIAQMAQSLVQSVAQQSERVTQEVYASAGGEANWNASTAVFNQSASPAYKQVVATMLDSGDPAQIRAAAQTIVEFGRAGGRLPSPAQGLGQLPNGALGGGTGISAVEFKTALAKLDAGRNTNPNWESERQELFASRAHGQRLGK